MPTLQSTMLQFMSYEAWFQLKFVNLKIKFDNESIFLNFKSEETLIQDWAWIKYILQLQYFLFDQSI
jgi:hypothetical protein